MASRTIPATTPRQFTHKLIFQEYVYGSHLRRTIRKPSSWNRRTSESEHDQNGAAAKSVAVAMLEADEEICSGRRRQEGQASPRTTECAEGSNKPVSRSARLRPDLCNFFSEYLH